MRIRLTVVIRLRGHIQLMSATDAFQLAMEVLILLLLLYLALLKSYFHEKGKNLATKEDVEEITSLVESVKSELQFSLQAKLSFRAEEHQALIDYFSKYSAWLSDIMNCSFTGIDEDSISRLSDIRSQLDAHNRDVQLVAGKMELFVENEDIRSKHGTLMIEMLKLQGHVQQMTFAYAGLYLEVQHMKLSTPLDKQVQRFTELSEKIRKLHKEFKEEQVQMFQAIFPLVQEQRRAITVHIRALANG